MRLCRLLSLFHVHLQRVIPVRTSYIYRSFCARRSNIVHRLHSRGLHRSFFTSGISSSSFPRARAGSRLDEWLILSRIPVVQTRLVIHGMTNPRRLEDDSTRGQRLSIIWFARTELCSSGRWKELVVFAISLRAVCSTSFSVSVE